MISQNQIERLVEAQEFRQLVDRILANGRCRSSLAKCVLTRPEVACPAAVGLALQRLAELTYRPVPLAQALARRLMQLQRSDGMFGQAPDTSAESLLAATAVALRGLLKYAAQHRSVGLAVDDSITAAITQALAAMSQRYAAGHDSDADATGWAIALWQLGDVAEFRRLIPVESLLAMLNESATDLVEDELCRYAHAMAA